MKRTVLRHTLFAVLVCGLSSASWAQLTNTVTLASGTALNLDTGATGASGASILWTETYILFQGSAKGLSLGAASSEYASLNQSTLQSLASGYSAAAIPASQLAAGDVFVLTTTAGNQAKVMVAGLNGTSLILQYTTYLAATAGPTITSVVNNYSFTPNGFPNSGVSPSTIAVVFGTGMSAAQTGALSLNSSAGPSGIPTTFNGATFTITEGSQTWHPAIYYVTPTQAAIVIPAAAPVGTATLTVMYNGSTSNSFPFQVVPTALGLDTYHGTGNGLATATDSTTGAVITPTNSAKPLENITLWGSGLGADASDSDTVFTTTPHGINQSVTKVYIGGVQANVGYAGSSGYPGLNQINVTVPSTITSGCGNSVVVVVNNVPSNFGTLPVNQGGGACNDSIYGISGSTINTLSGQTTVRSGSTIVGQLVTPTSTANIAIADFSSTTGAAYGGTTGITSLGSCVVSDFASGTASTSTTTPLDAGTLSLQGPPGMFSLTSSTKGSYAAVLPTSAIASTGGTFTFTGGGGADVGKFTSTVTLPNPLFNWTNQSAAASITRSNGVLVTWTGGTAGSLVNISGISSGDNSGGQSGSFTCYAPQSAGQFLVPSYVTDALPAGTGTLTVENGNNFQMFTATGLDYASSFGFTGNQVSSTYQ